MNPRIPSLRLVARSASFARQESGNSLIETALILPVLLLILAGAVDIGRAFRAAMIVNAAAQTGAAYGIHYPTDTAGMALAATTDTSKLVTVTANPTYGCECPDGSAAIPSCASEPSCTMNNVAVNSVYYVQVNTSATYTPVLPWPGLPKTLALKATVRLRASR